MHNRVQRALPRTKDMQQEEFDSLSDAELVARCKRGSKKAWEHFVRRFQRLIFTVPRRAGLSEDQAADVFQIVFTKAFEHLDAITQPDRIQAWLVTTAKRESITLLRQGKGRVSIDGTDEDEDHAEAMAIVDPDPLPDQQLEALQMQRELRRALERLDPKTQEFARLLFLEDEPLPYSEIAARLGISEGSIGPMRARCLEKLRAALLEKN